MTGIVLDGVRVLVVEDEAMVAMLVEDLLEDLGCTVIGPASNVAEALAIISREDGIDVALLDVDLAGKPSLPVADVLADRGIPSPSPVATARRQPTAAVMLRRRSSPSRSRRGPSQPRSGASSVDGKVLVRRRNRP